MSEILKINDLWGGYTEGVDILRGISLEVQQGEAVGIIGLNGSGKSTFGKAIMNMIPIRRGEILFDGKDITSLSTSQLAHSGISIMQQGGRVFPNLSAWDNLQLAAQGNNSQFSIVNSQLAELVPLLQRPKKELQRLMADKLSGGQKHQLSLAMTLATIPRLVILDEPSAGLSPKAVEEMYQMLRDVREKLNVTIILIEQNIAKAVEFCEEDYMFSQGHVLKTFKKLKIEHINNELFEM
ncbi:MAG: ATP-binding cassette domain-containing protein [Paludibacteraceae bacterium]|nr:ATP-binding cassette domain-containing protein [Paludibacteraceae bacterium]